MPLLMGYALKLVWVFPRLSELKWQTQELDTFSPLVIIQEELTIKLFSHGRLRQPVNIESKGIMLSESFMMDTWGRPLDRSNLSVFLTERELEVFYGFT